MDHQKFGAFFQFWSLKPLLKWRKGWAGPEPNYSHHCKNKSN